MAGHEQPQRASAAQLRGRVVDLRRQRWSFEEIGRELGFSKQRAWTIYQKALAEYPAASVAEHRAEELALVDDAVRDLLAIARNHKQPRTAVEAWNSIRGYMDRKAKQLGLDAPAKVEVTAEVDEQIAAIAAALAAWLAVVEPAGEAQAAGDAAAG